MNQHDGLAGDGARLDIGADEHTGVRLTLTGTPKLSSTITLKVTARATGTYQLAVDLQTGSAFIDPWGYLLLSQAFLPLSGNVTPVAVNVAIPNTSTLVGVTPHLQALVAPLPLVSLKAQLTNRVTFTIYR